MQSVKEFVICCRHGVKLCDQESVYKLIYVVVTKIPLGRGQSKMPILSRNVDKKSLDKWQSKTLFQSIFDPCLLIVDSVFNCLLPGVMISE